jgi:putative ABC transport system permease protein
MSTANVRILDDVVGESMRSPRFSAVVIAGFAVTALLLSALGATGSDITRMFLKQAAGPICVGVTLGTAGAFALGRLIQALLFGVSPHDTLSYLVAVSMLVGVALAASYLPVRRALQTDPARTLRG